MLFRMNVRADGTRVLEMTSLGKERDIFFFKMCNDLGYPFTASEKGRSQLCEDWCRIVKPLIMSLFCHEVD